MPFICGLSINRDPPQTNGRKTQRSCIRGSQLKITVVYLPNTVSARSKAWNVFDTSNAEIVGSNPTQGMDVSYRLYKIK
jgi:hypothetical protein